MLRPTRSSSHQQKSFRLRVPARRDPVEVDAGGKVPRIKPEPGDIPLPGMRSPAA